MVGIEALVRWLTRSGKLVGPDQFIPVAEETGLIMPIGRWVMRSACTQWVEWQRAGLEPPAIAVNLSPRQFLDVRLAEDIDEILRDTGMPVEFLQLEITESAAMDNPSRSFDMLDALHERGLHLYIDDKDDAEIADAIIRLAHALGIRVVAEGVETAEQVAFLRERRCDEIQGYVVSKPLPPDKASEVFGRQYGFG